MNTNGISLGVFQSAFIPHIRPDTSLRPAAAFSAPALEQNINQEKTYSTIPPPAFSASARVASIDSTEIVILTAQCPFSFGATSVSGLTS